MTSGCIF